MNRIMRFAGVVAVGFTVIASSVASAQTPADVTVKISNASADYVFQTNVINIHNQNVLGGGWKATVTGIPSALSVPSNLIVYCFDSRRQFAYNTNMNYTLLSFSDFLSNAGVTGGLRADQWSSVSGLDLNYMVEQVSTYGADKGVNTTIQENVWGTSNNGAANASPTNTDLNAFSDNWMILVDRDAWKAGVRKDGKFAGRQSFLVQIGGGGSVVPEPSSLALLAVGATGMAIVARRRRTRLS